MLARAAEHMYWLARYMARMDSLARLIEAAQLMAGMSSEAEEWLSALIAAGCDNEYLAKREAVTPQGAAHYLCCATDNPSAIMNCLEKARINARAMRTACTRDMWDAVNEAWLESRAFGAKDFSLTQLPDTLDWVRTVSTRFSGAYQTTMLRNEVYWFTRLGTFIERADNIARILDVKYHLLLPAESSGVGGMLDYYQWTSILRAVSAVRSYQWVYREEVKPWNVAELLILRPEMPRSLRRCYDEIVTCLEEISQIQGGRRGECHRLAGAISSQLNYGRISDIFQTGLHEYLTDLIDRSADLGSQISAFYMR
ncbi:MAG: alpha-E domain-containing protein [Caulobacterales bacterium]